ncbi:GNAT family N-acetyltransferase [Rathayibacter toxicus]|uniref:GNAT family N-acetyltransferase n=1 Tax=Rathayibacter toxicus TaxID=145458 RepID=UPI001C03C8E4|nr:GNAT family N-acetyltransferase [Rathayibacter toxicus]QWL30548.1 GNAT family N-acetyltransferase [Rathayibacter toxicus]QWL32656.1 GNAT family N-acetyltransferase [Rathayibacter toxicus]QWL34751.1 GNAT family N-acetyltransferase [Rathayibacter toxicus]QWL36882.1 GNAT family N-acetyltransferase [Rathayibacter toxicus]QWL38974.1 GNAT family N-acetyltransferase [Rathayibacter toxicus]
MTVALEPLSDSDLTPWYEGRLAAYVNDRIRSGDDKSAATGNAALFYERYFPDGKPAAGHDVLALVADGQPVGTLWLGPHPTGLAGVWWVWDLQIDDTERGRGYGRAAMLLAEEHVATRGGHALALNVFGFNTVARALYTSLGYTETTVQMRKNFEPG